jgi:hypothetical protein
MYDFHKTRNPNNESIFYHKLFIRGQKSLLKFIKRKLNCTLQKYENDEERYSEISDSYNSKYEASKPIKRIEELYMKALHRLEEITQRQNELEKDINIISLRNEEQTMVIEKNDIKEECNLGNLIEKVIQGFQKNNCGNICGEKISNEREEIPASTRTSRQSSFYFSDKNECEQSFIQQRSPLHDVENEIFKYKQNNLPLIGKRMEMKEKVSHLIISQNQELFGEVNSISPCLLSSPTSSTQNRKSSQKSYTFFDYFNLNNKQKFDSDLVNHHTTNSIISTSTYPISNFPL